MGMAFIEEMETEYDEEGNIITDASGRPRFKKVRRIPVNPNAIVPRDQGGGQGSEIKTIETVIKLIKPDQDEKKEELKILREQNQAILTRFENLVAGVKDEKVWGAMGSINETVKKLEEKLNEDPMEAYLTMQTRMKEHNIYPDGTSSPEVKKIDLEIEREITRRDTDMKMMGEMFKMANTAITKATDGPMAKAFARKIDQSDIIAEEEELPEDEALEAEIEEEVAAPPPQEQPPPRNPASGKGKKGKKKKR